MIDNANLDTADLDTIARQIADGTAPVDSWSNRAVGGYERHDDAREYFCHLASAWTGGNGRQRVARVTAYRDAAGRWTIGDVDVFTHAAEPTPRDNAAAAEILAAVDADPRRIVTLDNLATTAAA